MTEEIDAQKLESVETRMRQNEARLKQLEMKNVNKLIKERDRLKVLIGDAILSELEDLAHSNVDYYQCKQLELKKTLSKYTKKEHNKSFLVEQGWFNDITE